MNDQKRLQGQEQQGSLVQIRKEIRQCMAEGDILEAERLLHQITPDCYNRQDAVMFQLFQVFRKEVEKEENTTIFDVSQDLDEVMEHYMRIKMYLHRVELGLPEHLQKEVYTYCKTKKVSDYLILHILHTNIFLKKVFCENMASLFAREEGEYSMRANLFLQLAEMME